VVTSSGNPPLFGTVSYYDGNTFLGSNPVSYGVATWNAGMLSFGQHSFSAVFTGSGTSSTNGTTTVVSTDGPQIVGLSRYGFGGRPTVLSLTFDGPLDPSRAQIAANYELFDSHGHHIGIAVVQYDPATLTVKFVPARRLSLHRDYTLRVVGTGPNGLTTSSGLSLDGTGVGQPGTNFVTKVTWRALARPGSPPAVTFVDGQAHTFQGRFGRYFQAIERPRPHEVRSRSRLP
jgi:hypothetical protein